jgi:hypothetical protein
LTLTRSNLAAARNCVRGTNSGIMACHAGICTAAPTPKAKVKASSSAGGISPAAVSAASRKATTKR